ncbi:hypothetical protein BLL52_1649 [Rhodoferax antarcticus ANT.BR]|uniref:Uncharacterized protein n=1 Tax=Rhodoferax antarcticus ANT.BR TaxID=1111071 RepID=A0A1Q8YFX6_9BURK|nr:hypothetical protein BLL52_1649 [Rhodoferax antarcticus ANT.BR]
MATTAAAPPKARRRVRGAQQRGTLAPGVAGAVVKQIDVFTGKGLAL